MKFNPESGYYILEESDRTGTGTWHWAYKRLIEAFGLAHIRIAVPGDYGRSRLVGVVWSSDGKEKFRAFYLSYAARSERGEDPSDTFDLRDTPEKLEEHIASIKKVFGT